MSTEDIEISQEDLSEAANQEELHRLHGQLNYYAQRVSQLRALVNSQDVYIQSLEAQLKEESDEDLPSADSDQSKS